MTRKLQEVKKKRAEQVLILQRKCANELKQVDDVLKKAEEGGLFVVLLHIVPDSSDQVRYFAYSNTYSISG